MENCKKSPLDLTAKLEPTGLHVMFREAKSEDDAIPNLYVNTSLTRLGDFWKFLVSNYLSKVAQMFSDFWGIWKHHFYVKTAIVTFLDNFRKNWATFLIHYLVTLVKPPPRPVLRSLLDKKRSVSFCRNKIPGILISRWKASILAVKVHVETFVGCLKTPLILLFD